MLAGTSICYGQMTLTIPEVRPRVISDATFAALSELRRFRHFKRYYFSFDYDWDRLELVRSKYLACRDPDAAK